MSIGPLQIAIILVIILLFFGPKRLPGLAKSIGESIRGFKKSLNDTDDARDVTNTASEQLRDASHDETVMNQTQKNKEDA